MKPRNKTPLNLSAPVETDAAVTEAVTPETSATEPTGEAVPEPAPQAAAGPFGRRAAKAKPELTPSVTLRPRARIVPGSVQYRSVRETDANETVAEPVAAAPVPQGIEPVVEEPVVLDTPAPKPTPEPTPEPTSERVSLSARAAARRAARTTAPVEPAPEPEPVAAVTEPEPPAAETVPVSASRRAAERVERPGARVAYFLAALAAAVWAAGVAAFVIGYQGGVRAFTYDPFHLTVLGLLALAPIGLVFTMAYVIRQGRGLAAETRRARDLSQSMVAPAALASEQTAEVVKAMRAEIEAATAASNAARAELGALKEALALQTRELNQAADEASRTAKALEQSLSREREALTRLASGLEEQAAGIIAAVERQTQTTAEVSDLAQAQLREAEAALTARAADLAAAAGEATDAARTASDDLARQTIRLETAGSGVAEQIRSVEESLSQQRAALVAAGFTLRTDQEDFAAQVESQRAQLAESLSDARTAVEELNEASTRNAEMLSGLVVDAAEQGKSFAKLVDAERDAFQARIQEALAAFTATATDARDELVAETEQALAAMTAAAEEARKAADAAADAAQARIDNLGEAAFDAARRADEAFEARMTAAKRLFEESSSLIDEAGARASTRLEANLADVREALADIETALAELDGRAARLPHEARDRIEEIRTAVEQGIESLTASARKASAETQAVDAAFQERVKRNYDMLSEAVKLMGLVSGGSPAPRPRPEPETRRRAEPAPEPAPAPAPQAREEEDLRPAGEFGLRGRLKLTPPTASDEEFRDALETAGAPAMPPPGREREGWTWRDLLGSMDAGAETAETVEDEQLADSLLDEIRRLGVDPNALLPRSRVEAAADARQAGAPDSAREIVRRVAPAAARRISRHILTDKPTRDQAERFLAIYEGRIEDAIRKDPAGHLINSLLASEEGRTFLLIDAAIGDLG